jgi:hypothetical protein
VGEALGQQRDGSIGGSKPAAVRARPAGAGRPARISLFEPSRRLGTFNNNPLYNPFQPPAAAPIQAVQNIDAFVMRRHEVLVVDAQPMLYIY